MTFSYPWLLWLMPLAILPLLLQRAHANQYSWVSILPVDRLSNVIGLLLKVLAVLTLVFIILGLASPHTLSQKVERLGVGAQIVLVLDRSASMDDAFSGDTTGANGVTIVGETKSGAAARLISNFVKSRKQDMFGIITFSNSAMYVLPLSENKKAVVAAVQATSGNALFQTNIGSGLTSSAGLFDKVADSGSRAVILLSDGAGRVDANTQQKIRDWFDRMQISLYWIVLREPDGLSIFDEKYVPKEDSPLPAAMELHEFFKTFKTPFRAYEAENPQSLELAMTDINSREKKPIKYFEKISGIDYTNVCFIIAAIMMGLLLSVKYLEVKTWH